MYLNWAISSWHCTHRGKSDSLSHLYSSVSWETTNFESPKIFTASALASRSNSIPLRTASYSARLFVQAVGNLIEKEYFTPRGNTSRLPMPHPSPQANLSKYMAMRIRRVLLCQYWFFLQWDPPALALWPPLQVGIRYRTLTMQTSTSQVGLSTQEPIACAWWHPICRWQLSRLIAGYDEALCI
jgi:hypothetical protein